MVVLGQMTSDSKDMWLKLSLIFFSNFFQIKGKVFNRVCDNLDVLLLRLFYDAKSNKVKATKMAKLDL